MSEQPRTETLATRWLAVAGSSVVTALLTLLCAADSSASVPSHWTTSRAAQVVADQPPRSWVRRGWSVVMVNCDGLATQQAGSRYAAFSCEITLVAPMTTCPSNGDYVCVAGYDAFVLARTLRVLGPARYALSRVP